MGITKAIICIGCGKRFVVDRDEYEERIEESLCDKCRDTIAAAENINDVDIFESVSSAVTRVATSVSGKIEAMLKDNAKKQSNKNNGSSEDDNQ